VGGSVTGTLEYAGDTDSFSVHVEKGKTYAFSVSGAASGGGSLDAGFSGVSYLSYAAGSAAPDDYSAESRYVFTASESGDIVYSIGTANNGPHTGSYTLRAQMVSGDTQAPALLAPAPTLAGVTDTLRLGFDEAVRVKPEGFRLVDAAGNTVLAAGQLHVTALHNTVLVDPLRTLAAGQTYHVEMAAGSVTDMAGNAYAGGAFGFTTRPAAPHGSAAGDLLAGAAKGDLIDGDAGIDTVLYAGNRADYTVTNLSGSYFVQAKGAAAGDMLVHVERLLFADGALALDVNGNAGQAYRLYEAAFNRTPDSVGVGFWTTMLDRGVSLETIADAFVNSAEFVQLTGLAPTNAEFVDLLYQNVLHRAGEPGGVAFWNHVLDGGYSRAGVLAYFSESPENQAQVASLIADGFAYTPL
jgi:hypothetical protein